MRGITSYHVVLNHDECTTSNMSWYSVFPPLCALSCACTRTFGLNGHRSVLHGLTSVATTKRKTNKQGQAKQESIKWGHNDGADGGDSAVQARAGTVDDEVVTPPIVMFSPKIAIARLK